MFDVWLKRKMAARKVTAAQLADAIDVTEGTVSRWLNEERKPERVHMIRLALFFRVSMASIARNTDPDEFAKAQQLVKENDGVVDELCREPEIRAFLRQFHRLPSDQKAAIMVLMGPPEAPEATPEE